MVAGFPSRTIRAEMRMFVSSTTRMRAPYASGFVSLLLTGAFRANLAHGFVDDALQLVPVGVRVARLDALNGAMKYAPADRLFNEFRKIALFGALSTQKRAQREVGLF